MKPLFIIKFFYKTILHLILIIVMMSSCQELNTLLVEHPEYDVLELGRKQIKYDKNAPYPKEGYIIKGNRYKETTICRFPDNDTLYYIKYKGMRDDVNFYFTFINQETADTILENSLNKEKTPNLYKRKEYVDDVLKHLKIEDCENKNGTWTLWKPKKKWKRENKPTGRVKTGWQTEYEKFDYQSAKNAFYQQRNPGTKYKGMEVLGMLYTLQLLNQKGLHQINERTYQEDLLIKAAGGN